MKKGTVLVRMPEDMKVWLDQAAAEKGITAPEFIRTLISREKDRATRPKFNPFATRQQTPKVEPETVKAD